jgi:arylsulfatase A-like enzyme
VNRPNRRDFLKTTGAVTAGELLTASCSNPLRQLDLPERPNLVFFFTDQYRRQAFGFMDEDSVLTPNIVPDLYPTLLGLMGLAGSTPPEVEGTDHSSFLLGQSSAGSKSAFYLRPSLIPGPYDGLRGIRTEEYFLGVQREKSGEIFTLYDLARDPYHLRNIAEADRSVISELRSQLDQWLEITKDPWLEENL